MSSLAGTTEKLRSVLKIGGIAGAILFGIYLFIMGGIFVKNIFFPSAPDAPEQAFGQLPEIIFEQNASPAINYQINTVTGELPTSLPSRMLVYKLEKPRPDLLALQNSRKIASSAGFKDAETKISNSIYQWTNPTTNSVIKFDITSKSFEINSNLTSNQAILANAVIPDEDRMKRYVNDFLRSLMVDLENLSYTENSIKYYNFINNTLVEADNPFTAKLVRLSLYNNNIQNDLGDFSFVYPNPEFPLVTLLVAFPSSARMAVLGGESFNKIVSKESSDYPIKSPSTAFEDLQSGLGYLSNPNELNRIEITDVYLAYYLDKNTNEYAQPVYVFEGATAKAFVPATQYATTSAGVTSE